MEDDFFSNPNIVEAQRALAEKLKPVKDVYFIQWQHIHPSSYHQWLNDLEGFAKLELCNLNDNASTYSQELPDSLDDLDYFWEDVLSNINTKGLFPCLEEIPAVYFSTPIPNSHMIPLLYVTSKIMEPRNKNIFVADIVRVYNIDAINIPYDHNTWTIELIYRLKLSDSIEISFEDKKMWIQRTIDLYYNFITRQNSLCAMSWLAQSILLFVSAPPQHQSHIETALRIIMKEKHFLDDEASKYIGQLWREKWFAKKYRRRIEKAIKTYYAASYGRRITIKFSPSTPSSSLISSSSSSLQPIDNLHNNEEEDDDINEEDSSYCHAWHHDDFRTFWKEHKCECIDKQACLNNQYNIYTLPSCHCSPQRFCIRKAIQNELNRLSLHAKSHIIEL